MKIKNPASDTDPWAPDFEVGGGCWLYRHDDHTYTVESIVGERIEFKNGAGFSLFLTPSEAAKLMRPT